jgi:hypothetical protein
MATPEGEIVNAICEYLTHKRVFFWRQNTAPTVQHDGNGGIRFRKMPKYARKGVPDIIAIKGGVFYGIEVKTPAGHLSPEQHQFGRDLIIAGGLYVVARSIDDVRKLGL